MDVVTISGYHDVPVNNEESFLKALANQPLSVAIDASGRGFQFYSGVSLLPAITYLLSKFQKTFFFGWRKILIWGVKIINFISNSNMRDSELVGDL